jgi:hypothetical protein
VGPLQRRDCGQEVVGGAGDEDSGDRRAHPR